MITGNGKTNGTTSVFYSSLHKRKDLGKDHGGGTKNILVSAAPTPEKRVLNRFLSRHRERNPRAVFHEPSAPSDAKEDSQYSHKKVRTTGLDNR